MPQPLKRSSNLCFVARLKARPGTNRFRELEYYRVCSWLASLPSRLIYSERLAACGRELISACGRCKASGQECPLHTICNHSGENIYDDDDSPARG